VVTRVEDVFMMCDRRQESLKKLVVKQAPKPIQQVNPEPAVPLSRSSGNQQSRSKVITIGKNATFFQNNFKLIYILKC